MPAYKARFFREAVNSILSQTSDDWELVIVDDCSPDNLEEIVRQFDDRRIRYIRNEENIGGKDLVKQWNHSITYARGEWIVLAGDDDVYAPEFCEAVLALAAGHPGVDLIHSRVEVINEDGGPKWHDIEFPEYSSCYEYMNKWLSGLVLTCVGNFAFRRTALLGIGGFQNYPCAFCSDQATPLMLAGNGVANTSGLLFKFRESDIHLSGNRRLLKEKLEAMMMFYEWLDGFEYPAPSSDSDKEMYSIKNSGYLHAKCIYDCFNHAIRLAPLSELPSFLRVCRVAGPWEKMVMVARWIKRRRHGHTLTGCFL